MTQLPEFTLETYLAKYEFSSQHHMTASDAQCHSIGEILRLAGPNAIEQFLATPLSYTESFGADDLRNAIADTYSELAMENVLCFAGAEEGIYAFYRCVLEPDSHAIVVTPNYQSAETIPCSICQVTGVALRESENWTLDIDEIAAAIQPNTRSIYINFPHNPTGKILERDRYDALIELCRKHDIYLLSDEVYRLIERDEQLRLPQAADVYEKGVSLNVMSKAYGLPGLRVGWIACQDTELLDSLVKYKHYLSICNSAPSERLSLIALQHRETILQRNREIARQGRAETQAFLSEYPALFETYEPDGGVVMYPRLLTNGTQAKTSDVESFCRDMVEDIGAVLLPASIYKSTLTETPKDRFRIGYGRRNISDGLNAMRSYLNTD